MSGFAKAVQQLMAEHKMSERELTRRAGLNRQTLRNQLAGKSDFTLSDASKIAGAFGRRTTLIIGKPIGAA